MLLEASADGAALSLASGVDLWDPLRLQSLWGSGFRVIFLVVQQQAFKRLF